LYCLTLHFRIYLYGIIVHFYVYLYDNTVQIMKKNIKYLYRKAFFDIVKYMSIKEIMVITGMRRTGKSSLLKMLYDATDDDNKLILDIENPLDRAIFEETNYNNIFKNLGDMGIKPEKKAYIFLDEIQSFPDIVKPLKYLYDHYDVKFIVTGSSSFYLKNLFPESLAGRKIEFELFPLDFEEFLYFKGQIAKLETTAKKPLEISQSKILYENRIKWFDEYLTFGGFPQVVLAETFDIKKAYLRDIFKSYFQTDLLQLSNIRNISHLRNLIILLSTRVGNKVDITRLSSEIGVGRETVYNYIAFLTGSYFFHFIPRYGKNADKEVSSTSKVYICDTGLANELTKLSEGQLLENAVYINLRKFGKVQYFHDKSQKEIDFVLPEYRLAIEVKRNAIETDVNRLRKFSEEIGIEHSRVVSYLYSNHSNILPACLI
jgi:uncharacterized protein